MSIGDKTDFCVSIFSSNVLIIVGCVVLFARVVHISYPLKVPPPVLYSIGMCTLPDSTQEPPTAARSSKGSTINPSILS